MRRLTVHPSLSETLCARCQHGQVTERRNGVRLAWCYAMGEARSMPLDIVRCSAFLDTRHIDRFELEKIAWVIRHDRSGAIRGFEPPPPKKTE